MVDECDICGRQTRVAKYMIEGAEVMACSDCGKFGKPVATNAPQKVFSPPPKTSTSAKKPSKPPTQTYTPPAPVEFILKDDYGDIVKKARETEGLNRKELAMELNERENLLSRLEAYDYRPDQKLIEKLERRLLIKLTEAANVASTDQLAMKGSSELTLGDVVKIKKDKKK